MAEGILRNAASELIDVASAGSNPSGYVHPKAITALNEIGIDISSHTSKHMNDFLDQDIHTVITVCGNADQESLILVNFTVITGDLKILHMPREVKMKSWKSSEK